MLGTSFRRLAAARLTRRCAAFFGLLFAGGMLVSSGACSLGNIAQTDCTTQDQCILAIGPASQCVNGYCTDPPRCVTGHDCRKIAGGGACVDGFCVSNFPVDAQCSTIMEPENLPDLRLAGPDAPLVIGSIFSLDEPKDVVLTQAVRLAVREINENGKMNRGQRLAVVVCDNGGPGNTAQGADRDALNNHAMDYLGGTLGVPYIVGPLSSADSLRLIARLLEKSYPTAIISPSATSPALSKVTDNLPGSNAGLFWRTCPSDVQQGAVLAQNVVDPTFTNVAVVFVSDPYGQGLADAFVNLYGTQRSKLFPIPADKIADPNTLAQVASAVDASAPQGVLVISVQAGNTVDILKAMVGKPVAAAQFYFTDGTKDAAQLLSPSLPPEVQAIISKAKGTAPASPVGTTYDFFLQTMKATWGVDAANFSFTAQAYDAAYVGAYGTIWASRVDNNYDGTNVSEGMGKLSAGAAVEIRALDWPGGKDALSAGQTIDINGTSGPLDFDPAVGEAMGRIEIWSVSNGQFVTETTITP